MPLACPGPVILSDYLCLPHICASSLYLALPRPLLSRITIYLCLSPPFFLFLALCLLQHSQKRGAQHPPPPPRSRAPCLSQVCTMATRCLLCLSLPLPLLSLYLCHSLYLPFPFLHSLCLSLSLSLSLAPSPFSPYISVALSLFFSLSSALDLSLSFCLCVAVLICAKPST